MTSEKWTTWKCWSTWFLHRWTRMMRTRHACRDGVHSHVRFKRRAFPLTLTSDIGLFLSNNRSASLAFMPCPCQTNNQRCPSASVDAAPSLTDILIVSETQWRYQFCTSDRSLEPRSHRRDSLLFSTPLQALYRSTSTDWMRLSTRYFSSRSRWNPWAREKVS